MRLVIAWIVIAAAACRSHPPTAVEIDGESCVACHRADYDRAPDHPGRFPETCGDCHRNDAWRPALEFGHPEASFPVAEGAHEVVACLECHEPERGPSTEGGNTDCTGCHTGEHEEARVDRQHDGIADYAFQADVPNFCLECHPDGQADNHPEDKFPITRGAHQMPCADCHDAALGPNTDGANVSCIGCHTGEHSMSRMADRHREIGGYSWQPSNPDFCRRCHPSGRE